MANNQADYEKALQMAQMFYAMQGQGGGNGLPQLPGQNLLQQGGVVDVVKALQNIPMRAPTGITPEELGGYAPSGMMFTGGSPFKHDFTPERIQNTIYLLNQLAPFFMNKKKPPTAKGNSVETGQPGYSGGGIEGLLKLFGG